MSIQLYAMTCGWLRMPLGTLLDGESGEVRIPVPAYLIVHERGTALFDSGLAPVCHSESVDEYMGAISSFIRVEFQPGEELVHRLEPVEVDPARVDWLINSHLHFDHAGGNAQVPNARVLVQRPEWEAAHEPDLIEAVGYKPVDYDLGHEVVQLDGEHDLFGDGSVVCLPTYGHTPGHQSLRVRLEGGEVVLAGDACYLRQTLEKLQLPKIVHDREAMHASLIRLRALEEAGARIFFGHDPEFWRDVPQAPRAIA